ncbi:CDP-diacylglycerol--glycerol-3-phosphate 3-phosphatidyltransferase [Neoehrlichia mikurensis]|uniref:CDP-diacylglycerol--glycerol-3-phosphate 3-phosphatidyltransferase n=1 Tax=Neoehrlichia mikurensis TaxID=89586 RepID=A0A9Q9F458_9RICK|nr:CDP-diacylglycerol--glycerol-3-phosphate 3-phosphatidyltransferase [Neoehrlichia mikurensis]QXK91624.1 CDP-diacylglycerol--glycerol-3-phosphate 3-phosphatidyltransferase [Neoehrlichia mikurensis]QXK92835.1 CDP-diacylglycerol--glycerol-3-phosphate 3-phosphatidyltransferase [Neoehrlichia mikurensis]QXK93315.1 CDP-diacylglycerol--glycerol-3-phosphate 3-phosphatidyltransferase [Neoehrlichia mikurensis]UTO55742.1 CDP-diacylglycerol--glycerol-3-phosphate 3-phosphatidyltransferase [Neoehrlichia mik
MNYLRKVLPNLLTVLRVMAIPAIVISFYIKSDNSSIITLTIFVFACITDFFDGYLARMWKTQSKFGKLFDPIADKLIFISTVIMLTYIHKITNITIIFVIIMVCREILISGLREFLITMNIKIPVIRLGKAKTLVQMVAIGMLIVDNEIVVFIGEVMLIIATILTVYSGYVYACVAFKRFSD